MLKSTRFNIRYLTQVLRVARIAGGTALLLAGAVLLVLPGPGIPMVLGALILLETEFHWARRLRVRLMRDAGRLGASLRSAAAWLLSRAAYGLALLPLLTDWVDTGHWPHHPREFVTEIIVGTVIFFGVWRLHRRAERFRSLAETDPLTGLGNRARFRADLEAAVARAQDERRSVAVGIVDVDRFKSINDTFGHAAGDEVLREVGVALDRSVRQGIDGCYRLGGDEFAVLVAGPGSQHVLAALRRSFDRASKVLGEPISCSIGVVAHRNSEGLDELVHRADSFMYAAKRGAAADGDDAHSFGRVELGAQDARQPSHASGQSLLTPAPCRARAAARSGCEQAPARSRRSARAARRQGRCTRASQEMGLVARARLRRRRRDLPALLRPNALGRGCQDARADHPLARGAWPRSSGTAQRADTEARARADGAGVREGVRHAPRASPNAEVCPPNADVCPLNSRHPQILPRSTLRAAPRGSRASPRPRPRLRVLFDSVGFGSSFPLRALGKLLDHSIRFGGHVGTMNLVSNAKFDVPLDQLPTSREREEIRLSELAVDAVAEIREKLRAELGVQDELSLDKVYLITSGISLTEHAKHGAGELAAFLDRRRPGGLYAVQPLYRALCDELARRATHEWQPTSFLDLCKRKGIGRAELESFLLTADATFDPQRELAAVKEQLGREGVSYRDQLAIESGWRRYQIESMDESNVTVQGLTSNIRSALAEVRSGTAWNSLLELVHAVVHVLGTAKESGLSPSYLEGAVLFELKTVEARELQAIGSQPETGAQ